MILLDSICFEGSRSLNLGAGCKQANLSDSIKVYAADVSTESLGVAGKLKMVAAACGHQFTCPAQSIGKFSLKMP